MNQDDDAMERFRVLLVCRANICRSPTAELLLGQCLREHTIDEFVDVSSAGVTAEPGQEWCAVAARWVSDGPDRDKMMEMHRSRQLDRAMVAESDIILTADLTQRAAVVQLIPKMTQRTFTLRESAGLAGAVIEQLADSHTQRPRRGGGSVEAFTISSFPRHVSPGERLRWLTSEMHSARGLIRLPQVHGRNEGWVPWRRKGGVSGLDIPDSHDPMRVRHQLSLIRDAVEAWAAAAAATIRHANGGPV